MAYSNLLSENISPALKEVEFPFIDHKYIIATLAFNMEPQTQSNWCWAATAKSVSYFYSALTPWTQCKVAGSELTQTCCSSPVPSACNVPWYLDKALSRTDNYVSMQGGTITWAQIRQELNKGLVVGARIGWNGGGGHFMVIHGVAKFGTTELLYIDDPIYKKSVLTYNQFATNYQGSGSWTHTYFTKKRLYIMWKKDININSRLLKPIDEIRPLSRANDPNFNAASALGVAQFATPHYTYIMGLNEINKDARLPEKAASLRVLEFEASEPQAIYEVGLDEDNPEFLQLQSDKTYFNNFENALEKLKQESNQDVTGEIRHIRVPALNIEAAWLHYENGEPDKYALIRQFGNERSRVMNEREFIDYLNGLKARMGQVDELMGA